MYSGEDLHFTLYAPRGNTVIMALILSQNKTWREKEPGIVFVSVREQSRFYISGKNDFDTTLPPNASLQSNGQLHDHYPIIFCTCCSARLRFPGALLRPNLRKHHPVHGADKGGFFPQACYLKRLLLHHKIAFNFFFT